MWFGLQFPDPDGECETAIVHAYQDDHVFRVAAEPENLPTILSLLRDAAVETGELRAPRCPECGAEFEVPCASA